MYLGSFELDDRLSDRYPGYQHNWHHIKILKLFLKLETDLYLKASCTARSMYKRKDLIPWNGRRRIIRGDAWCKDWSLESEKQVLAKKNKHVSYVKKMMAAVLTFYSQKFMFGLRIKWCQVFWQFSVYRFGQSSKLTNKRSAEENPIRTKVLGFFKSKIYLRHFLTMPEKI